MTAVSCENVRALAQIFPVKPLIEIWTHFTGKVRNFHAKINVFVDSFCLEPTILKVYGADKICFAITTTYCFRIKLHYFDKTEC